MSFVYTKPGTAYKEVSEEAKKTLYVGDDGPEPKMSAKSIVSAALLYQKIKAKPQFGGRYYDKIVGADIIARSVGRSEVPIVSDIANMLSPHFARMRTQREAYMSVGLKQAYDTSFSTFEKRVGGMGTDFVRDVTGGGKRSNAAVDRVVKRARILPPEATQKMLTV